MFGLWDAGRLFHSEGAGYCRNLAILRKAPRILWKNCLLPPGHSFLVKIRGFTRLMSPPHRSPSPLASLPSLAAGSGVEHLSGSTGLKPQKYPLHAGGQRSHMASILSPWHAAPSISTHVSSQGQACGLWKPPLNEGQTGLRSHARQEPQPNVLR